jgi:hypothetical protein
MVVNVHTTATQGEARTHFEGPRNEDPRKQALGFARRQVAAQEFLGNLVFSGVFDRPPKLKVPSSMSGGSPTWCRRSGMSADYRRVPLILMACKSSISSAATTASGFAVPSGEKQLLSLT